jgi:hypothetical protein
MSEATFREALCIHSRYPRETERISGVLTIAERDRNMFYDVLNRWFSGLRGELNLNSARARALPDTTVNQGGPYGWYACPADDPRLPDEIRDAMCDDPDHKTALYFLNKSVDYTATCYGELYLNAALAACIAADRDRSEACRRMTHLAAACLN